MSEPFGFLDSVKAVLATLAAMVHNRVELLSTEFQEEMARLVAVILWGMAALLCAVIGLTFIAVLILLVVDPVNRALAAGILAAVFLLIALVSALSARRLVLGKPRPFDASLAELQKDYDDLRDER